MKKTNKTPLYQRIANDIQISITAEDFDFNNPICTESSLCEKYSVSRITAKRAIKELVESGLIYRKRGVGSFAVGPACETTIVRPVANKVFSLLIPFETVAQGGMYLAVDSINQVLTPLQHQLTIYSSYSLERDADLLRILFTQNVDGIIYYPRTSELPLDALNAFVNKNLPVIILDQTFPFDCFSSVVCDHYKGGYLLAEHLISYGHKNICYLSCNKPEDLSTIHSRYGGLADCLIANKINTPPRFVHWTSDEGEGYHMLKHLVNAMYHDGVTAVLCETDQVAFNVYICCNSLGIRVPDDISITGFDNINWATTGGAHITTIDQNFASIGKSITDILLQDSYTPSRTVIPVNLVPRRSTGRATIREI